MSTTDVPDLATARASISVFGAVLRETRREREQSLRDVAAQIGCDFPMLSRIEKGQAIPTPELEEVIRAWLSTST